MVVLQTHLVTAAVGLEPNDFQLIIGEVESRGWIPGYLSAERALLQVAGVREIKIPPSSVVVSIVEPEVAFSAEFLFRDDDLYFVESGVKSDDSLSASLEDVQDFPLSQWSDPPFLNVGIISASAEGIHTKLEPLLAQLSASIQAKLDGRKTRHMRFEWTQADAVPDPTQPFISGKSRARRINYESSEKAKAESPAPEISLLVAQYTPEEEAGAKALCDQFTRTILREICQARGTQAKTLNVGRPKEEARTAAALGTLTTLGLVVKEILISCRKTSAPLLRVASTRAFESGELARARCHNCQSPLSDESRSEVYVASELGESLNRSSHWLTVWTTVCLANEGIPNTAVRWSVSESGEEVDLVAAVFDESWIFELKDREFGAGDAHPFSYRRARYSPDRAYVVTPAKVSDEAKRIFREIASDRTTTRYSGNRRSKPRGSPVYVEGLAQLEPSLRREVTDCATRYALARLDGVRLATHIAVSQILTSKFAEPNRARPP